MAFVSVDGKMVHVRLTRSKTPGGPVELSSNDRRAIEQFSRALDKAARQSLVTDSPQEYQHETFGQASVVLGPSPSGRWRDEPDGTQVWVPDYIRKASHG